MKAPAPPKLSTANFEIKTETDFQADSLLPGELELSYY